MIARRHRRVPDFRDKLENVFDAARYVRPAIDEVAEKDERVRCFITREKIEQTAQMRTTAGMSPTTNVS